MNCEIIKDLLPLYDEKLCSTESAALVEEHIKTCADCKALLEKLPKTELPKADTNALKPFVKVKRKLRARIVGLISLGVVLLAVLIPVGYLTVNQIFHFNGGTDFEDLIYKHEIRQFAEMIVEGRMEEYAEHLGYPVIYEAPDGTTITYRSFYLEQLKAAYEKVEKYNLRVGEIHSSYHNFRDHSDILRDQYFHFEYTGTDSSEHEIMVYNTSKDGKEHRMRVWYDPRSYLYGPEKSFHELCSEFTEDDIPDDLRDIYAFLNTLYLADDGDHEITFIEKLLNAKSTADTADEEWIDKMGNMIAIRFAVSDYNAVYDGYTDYMKSNCLLYTSIFNSEFDAERKMFYYPVTLTGYDGEHETAIVKIKLYLDEYGFHSPRPNDIEYITGISDLAAKLAGILG